MKFIDLFCGCGGFSEGLKQAGHQCILAIDNQEIVLKSHKANHPEAEHWEINILELNRDELPDADFIVGSPPCQGFSVVNRNRSDNPDLRLVQKFLDLTEGYNIFVGENVLGIRKYVKTEKIQQLNATDFGLYHRRTRIFFGKFNTVKKITRNKTYFPTPRASNKNGTTQMAINTTMSKRGKKKGKPLYAFQLAYPWYVSRWLMGFPEDYIFCGTLREKERQIGNAVCPPVARAIGEAIGGK